MAPFLSANGGTEAKFATDFTDKDQKSVPIREIRGQNN
jgi:hypothetical protein